VFLCPRFKKEYGDPESANKKLSAIARDSICGTALCPSRPFRLFGAIRLIFCVDNVLLPNKYAIVTACRVIHLIFRVGNKNTNIVVHQNG
jgi:hypothetical protein